MKHFALTAVLVHCLGGIAFAGAGGFEGTVQSLHGNSFVMDADRIEMTVYADGNTRFKIGAVFVSASYIAKGAHVIVAGTSDRVGSMNALLVTIIPSTETVSGTVKSVKSGEITMETDTDKNTIMKVRVTKLTRYFTGAKAVEGARGRGNPTEASKVKVGVKIQVTPITNLPDAVDAWEINIIPAD